MGHRLTSSFATLVALLASAGCVNLGDDTDADEPTEPVPVASVTVPPERLTPFCQAMIELSEKLETDPPDDATDLILDTYLGLVDEVPPEIEDDFLAVVAALQGARPSAVTATTEAASATSPETTAPSEDFDAEGYLPDDQPNQRLNDYVQFTCRDSQNNPGPPPTQPLDDIVVDDTIPA